MMAVKRGSDMNEITFIICTNDEKYMAECRFYIERLIVPPGMNVSVIPIENAVSMTAGYNQGMHASDARYKVYLHQDVFIVNQNFIIDMLTCFRDGEGLGMIGVAGTRRLHTANAWSSLDIGGCYCIGAFSGHGYIAVKREISNPEGRCEETDHIDGMLLATSYDVEWDERLGGFHFYDLSQCIRFRECGLKTAVVRQDDLWTFHDLGPLNLETYDQYKMKFSELYHFPPGDSYDDGRIYRMCDMISASLRQKFDSRQFQDIEETLRQVDNAIYFSQDLLTMYFAMEIDHLEQALGIRQFLETKREKNVFSEICDRWNRLKWDLIRTEFGYETSGDLANGIITGNYSVVALIVVAIHSLPREVMDRILEEVGQCLSERGGLDADVWDEMLSLVRNYEASNVPLV